MANGHGGPRTPTNPAPASGPGRLSKRTDGGPAQSLSAPTGMDYGAHKALMDQERTAPMAQADSQPTAQPPVPLSGATNSGYAGPGMGDPSTRPDEPVTAGVDIGAGPGPDAMSFDTAPAAKPDGYVTSLIQKAAAADTTGTLADLYLIAKQRGV